MKKCPICNTEMTQGAPHAEGDAWQWECHNCGYIERVSRESSIMKALSIKQPWAWLICVGYKDIENRDWRMNKYQMFHPSPMRIYVHAGKTDDWNEEVEGFLYRIFDADVPYKIPRLRTSPEQFGAIIGEVDITGCVTESKSPWFTGKYGFTLANPALYNKPIPCRGKLGFFAPELPIIYKEK